jgi:hypothetical protein
MICNKKDCECYDSKYVTNCKLPINGYPDYQYFTSTKCLESNYKGYKKKTK